MDSIDIGEVIKRLKEKMELDYDAELARKLGIEKTYLGAMKSRGEFTGTAWNAILKLCRKNNIDLEYALFGDLNKKTNPAESDDTESKSTDITLSPIKGIKDMINLSWLIREIDIPKGTFIGWMRRNDSLLETKNDIPAHYRREVLYKLIFKLEELRDQVNKVIQTYRQKLEQLT